MLIRIVHNCVMMSTPSPSPFPRLSFGHDNYIYGLPASTRCRVHHKRTWHKANVRFSCSLMDGPSGPQDNNYCIYLWMYRRQF